MKNKEDIINKVEDLIGYLEYFVNKRTELENRSDEIRAVVAEAKEWVHDFKKESV